MNISEILTLITSKIQEVSGMRASPLYSNIPRDECCVYSLGAGVSSGTAGGVLKRYSLRIRVSARRYCDAADIMERISSALCSDGNTPPSWDGGGYVLALVPSGNTTLPEYEYDAEFSQIEREYYLYVRR